MNLIFVYDIGGYEFDICVWYWRVWIWYLCVILEGMNLIFVYDIGWYEFDICAWYWRVWIWYLCMILESMNLMFVYDIGGYEFDVSVWYWRVWIWYLCMILEGMNLIFVYDIGESGRYVRVPFTTATGLSLLGDCICVFGVWIIPSCYQTSMGSSICITMYSVLLCIGSCSLYLLLCEVLNIVNLNMARRTTYTNSIGGLVGIRTSCVMLVGCFTLAESPWFESPNYPDFFSSMFFLACWHEGWFWVGAMGPVRYCAGIQTMCSRISECVLYPFSHYV